VVGVDPVLAFVLSLFVSVLLSLLLELELAEVDESESELLELEPPEPLLEP